MLAQMLKYKIFKIHRNNFNNNLSHNNNNFNNNLNHNNKFLIRIINLNNQCHKNKNVAILLKEEIIFNNTNKCNNRNNKINNHNNVYLYIQVDNLTWSQEK